ncbi:AAA family ATPase [Streptomyces cellulosae]|uniref:AAA family ATPase n=1 Tax=Streptomyces cellulosae TaxID=1968 RepID=UPI0004CA5612|nr:LuxR family transcriptional regulator [Streptomyces cellulosae]
MLYTHEQDPERFSEPTVRQRQLAVLMTRVTAALRGTPEIVRLCGDSGMGKTHLLSAALTAMRPLPAGVFHTRCVPGAGAFTAARAVLAASTQQDTALAIGPGLRDKKSERHMLLALLECAQELMRQGPVVLVLDDFHHCDLSSVHWLDHTLRRARAASLAVVVSHPPGDLGRDTRKASCHGVFSGALGGAGQSVIELEPLSLDETALLIETSSGRIPEEPFTAACHEVTGGVPRELIELLRVAGKQGILPLAEEAERIHALGVSVVTVRGLDWLKEQPAPLRSVARAVAVAGTTRSRVVAELAGVTAFEGEALVTSLFRAGVLVSGTGTFRSADVREQLLRELSADQQVAARLRAARLLREEGRPAEEVARPCLELPPEALSEPWMLFVLRQAAVGASHEGRVIEAIHCLEHVLRAVPEDESTKVLLAETLSTLDLTKTAHRLREILKTVRDPRARALIAVALGPAPTVDGRLSETTAALREIVSTFDEWARRNPQPDDPELRTQLEAALVFVGIDGPATLRGTLERSRALVPPQGGTSAERSLLRAMAGAQLLDGVPAQQVVGLARAGLGAGTTSLGVEAIWPAFALYHAGEVETAVDLMTSLYTENAHDAGGFTECAALSARAYFRMRAGFMDLAAADAWTAVQIGQQEHLHENTPFARYVLALVLARQGFTDQAEALLTEDRSRKEWVCAEHFGRLMVSGLLREARGDHSGALSLLHRCGRELADAGLHNPVFAPWWVDAVRLLVQRGRTDEARDIVARTESQVVRWGTAEGHGLMLLARGMVAGGTAGLALLNSAVETLEQSPVRLARIDACVYHGEALMAADRFNDARGRLRGAVHLAVACGDLVSARRARRLLKTAGGRMPELATKPAETLTARERRVAELAAEGLSNRRISETLFVTLRTVESHLSSVYRKLGIELRTELGAALDTGLSSAGGAD